MHGDLRVSDLVHLLTGTNLCSAQLLSSLRMDKKVLHVARPVNPEHDSESLSLKNCELQNVHQICCSSV